MNIEIKENKILYFPSKNWRKWALLGFLLVVIILSVSIPLALIYYNSSSETSTDTFTSVNTYPPKNFQALATAESVIFSWEEEGAFLSEKSHAYLIQISHFSDYSVVLKEISINIGRNFINITDLPPGYYFARLFRIFNSEKSTPSSIVFTLPSSDSVHGLNKYKVTASIVLDQDIENYIGVMGNPEAKRRIENEFANFISVPSDQIQLVNVLSGSTYFVFEVASNSTSVYETLKHKINTDNQTFLEKPVLRILDVGYQIADPTEITFQNGFQNFNGSLEVGINSQYAATWNNFKGLTSLKGPHSVGWNTEGTFKMLIRLKDIYIPAGNVVSKAILELWYTSWECQGTIQGAFLKYPFDEASSNLGFTFRDDSNKWASFGLNESDYYTTDQFSAPCSSVGGDSKVAFNLSPSLVQQWISNPKKNFGLVISINNPPSVKSFLKFYSSEMSELQYRPKLTLNFKLAPFDPSLGLPSFVNQATLSVKSSNSLSVSWTVPTGFPNVPNPTEYLVEWSLSPTFETVQAATTAQTSIDLINLPTNKQIWVRLKAKNTNGYGQYRFTSPQFAIAAGTPSEPQNLQIIIKSPNSALLQWQAPKDDGGSPILGYYIEARAANIYNTYLLDAKVSEYLLENFPSNTEIQLSMSSFNTATNSTKMLRSVSLTAQVPDPPSEIILLLLNYNQINIKWKAPKFNGGSAITQYTVEVSSKEDFTIIESSIPVSLQNISPQYELVVDIKSPVSGNNYYVRVQAVNKVSKGKWGLSDPTYISLSPQSDLKTLYLQNGRNGYNGAKEVVISTQYIDKWNYYNGVTYGMTKTQYTHLNGAMTVQDSQNDVFRPLIRFDQIDISPKENTIVEARLTLAIETWASPLTIKGFYVSKPWEFNHTVFDKGDQYKRIGWAYRTPTTQWTAPGGLNDTLPDSSINIDLIEDGVSYREVLLDPKIVQKWISGENYGLIFVMATPGKKASIISVTGDKLSKYSMLKLSYYSKNLMNNSAPSLFSKKVLAQIPRSIFVDTLIGNDDLNNGDQSQPVKTLATAVDIAKANDVIYLNSGVYAAGINIVRPNITLTSTPNQWAVIAAPLYDPSIGVAIVVRPTAHGFHLTKLELTGGYYFALATFTTFDWYGPPEDRERLGTGPLNLQIDYCKIHDSGYSLIKFKMATGQARIEFNELYNSGQRHAIGGHAFEMVNVKNIKINDNYIHDIRGAGIKASGGCQDIAVERNLMKGIYLCGALLGFYEETEYMNWISNRKWYECIRCSAVSNIFIDVQGCGVGFYAALDSFAYHNSMHSVGQSLMPPFLINGVQHWENGTAQGSPITSCLNITLINNIVVKSRLARKGMHFQIREVVSWQSDSIVEPGLQGNISSENNLYYSEAEIGGTEFKWGHGAMLEDERKISYFVGNVTGWRGNKSWEKNSFEANPGLDTSYRLLKCSPAIKAGKSLPNNILDYDGNEFEFIRDIGATQYSTPDSKKKPFPPLPSITNREGYKGPGLSTEHIKIWPFDILKTRTPITYFVSASNGSDSSNGTTLQSCLKTISKALSLMLPSDKVLIRGGIYKEALRIQLPNITIEAFEKENVKIQVPNDDSNVGNAIFFADSGSGNYGGSGAVTIRGLDISGGFYYTIMFNQAGGGTNNEYWRWFTQTTGLKTPTATLIEDCILHESGSNVVKLSPESNDIIFRRVEIYRSGKRGSTAAKSGSQEGNVQLTSDEQSANVQAGNGIDIRNGNNILIQDCYIHDISGTGILIGGGAKNVIVERTLVKDVNVIGIMAGSFNTEAQYMRLQENPELYQAIATVIRNNIVYNAGGAGIALYSTKGAKVTHNTLINVANTMHAAILFNIAPNYVNGTTQVLPPCEDSFISNNIITQGPDAVGYMFENRVWTSETPVSSAYIQPSGDCNPPESPQQLISQEEIVSKTSGIGGKCPIFPPSHPLNTDITKSKVHPRSDLILKKLRGKPLHPDFGGYLDTIKGPVHSGFGIARVNRFTPKITVDFLMYPQESDAGPYPMPLDSPVEGAPNGCDPQDCPGDRHTIAFDEDNCMLYETWRAQPKSNKWEAANGAIFNLTSTKLRPLGWTSADAAGLPIFPTLIKYEEVQSGEIKHAMRITFQITRKAYVFPATHYASYETTEDLLGMGYRLRLRNTFDCNPLSRSAKVICTALKNYGAIVADNGADWYLSGEAHPNWNTTELQDLRKIPTTEFDVIWSGEDCLNPECTPIIPPKPFTTASAIKNLSSLVMDYNLYYKKASDYDRARFEFVDRDPIHFWRSWLDTSLESWQVHSNSDKNSKIANPLLATSLLPLTNSPVLSAAPLIDSEVDFLGYKRKQVNNLVDIGAISLNRDSNVSIRIASGRYPPSLDALFADPCEGNSTINNIVYVSVNGSDSSCTGTIGAPFKTIKIAVRRCGSNCTINVLEGTYEGGLVIGKEGTKIIGAISKKVIIRQTFLDNKGDVIAIRANRVSIENLEIVGGYHYSVSIDSSSDVLIRNCTLHGSGRSIIAMLSSNVKDIRILNNSLRNSGQRIPREGDAIRVIGSINIIIMDNIIINIRSSAIHFREGARNSAVARNTIVNSRLGVSVGNDNANRGPLPDWFDYSALEDNYCYWVNNTEDASCHAVRDISVIGNIIGNVDGAGVMIAAGYNITVAGNTLYRVATTSQGGIYLTAVQHFINNKASPIATNDYVNVLSNIILLRGESVRPFILFEHATDWGSSGLQVSGFGQELKVNNNIYFREAANFESSLYPARYFSRNGYSVSDRNKIIVTTIDKMQMDLTAWKTKGFDANSIVQDPLLDNQTLALKKGSVALNSGTKSTINWLDNIRGNSSDIGAYQTSVPEAPRNISNLLKVPLPKPWSFSTESIDSCDNSHCWHPWLGANSSTLGIDALLQKCLNNGSMFPSNHPWGRDISQDRVHAFNTEYLDSIGITKKLHPDYGTTYGGAPSGIPFIVVDDSVKKQNLTFRYSSESEKGPYPIPEDAPVEGGALDSNGDRHVLVVQKSECKVYELFKAVRIDNEYRNWVGAAWTADSGAIFDFKSNNLRPLGWTSTDAAGLSIFAGLVLYDEVQRGEIKHPIRFTVSKSQMAYITPPATHFASSLREQNLPPMGLRFRLKANYNCNTYNYKEFSVVCRALKKFGLIVADNGSDWFFTGSADPRWDDSLVGLLKSIPSSAFEAVDTGDRMCTTPECK